MADNSSDRLTSARRFLEPSNSTHRQYEALRAFFVEGLPSSQAAARFGYTPGSFRVLVHQFRNQPGRRFLLSPAREVRPPGKQKRLRDQVVSLRKQNLSVHDISRALAREDESLSPAAVATILKEEGFAKLPRRWDEERPDRPRPVVGDVADVRQLDLTPRAVHTDFGGLFLFLPDLVSANLDAVLERSSFPGSKMVPAACAMRSLLGLKLFGNARHSHVMSSVLDEGLALFAGLNVIPKRSFLTEYSCRIEPSCYPTLMRRWFDTVSRLGLRWGTSFNLDFHTIPFHGEDALVEKHYVSKRSRQQKGILAFLAQDADTRVFCYAKRMLIENNIADGIDFFHMDALSSAVAMKVNCDLQLTLMASSLYRLLAVRVGNGYETTKSRQLFLDFINASADITITKEAIVVKFQKRAHNPLLVAAGFDKMGIAVPWLGGKQFRFIFG